MSGHMEEVVALTLLISLLGLFSGPVHAESFVTISGVVSEEGQLIGNDGVIYEIADNEPGFQLMELTGRRVTVTGQVVPTNDFVMLIVDKFEIVRK